jgi:16S rRNA (guanine527-N7)-methyltransferase
MDRLVTEAISGAKLVKATDRLAIDVGSGGGSPAVPLKIACSNLRMVMVESKVRKSAFLRDVVRQLGLLDAEVLTCRLEELLSRPDLAQSADVVTIRAVRAEARLWGQVHGLLKPGGRALWFHSASSAAAIQTHPLLALHSTHHVLPSLGSAVSVLKRLR